MKRVYIAGPISKGDICENVSRADDAMLALMKAGHAPFNPMLSTFAGCSATPHGLPRFYPDAKAHGGFRDLPHSAWIAMDRAWVAVSDAVLRLPGESVGADQECEHAKACGVPVFDTVGAVLAWAGVCVSAADVAAGEASLAAGGGVPAAEFFAGLGAAVDRPGGAG